ncbi:Pancreatic secretory granule membrane major glycoprotein GP2 [Stylophora pistillata]|uniref:Pancreatic secretory granule membrane major glycoprotein GP2 n=1 Tax=Stylophora pistillata TaxID=50429 RepID=A0A2B4QYY4_STYPI|nr:Pancreatic secretory granule membrane major glycoprotein GP2 [Stylophora pistillata]
MNEVLLLSCLVLCAAGTFEHSDEDIHVRGFIEDSGGDTKKWLRGLRIAVDNQPVGNEGNLLEQDEKSKEDNQETEQSVIHGEGFDPKDLALDFDEDTSKVTIDGVKGAENEPEGDPALEGDKEDTEVSWKRFFKHPIEVINNQPPENKDLLEKYDNGKKDDQPGENSMINGEEFSLEDAGFDPVKISTDKTIHGDEGGLEPKEDPANLELNPCEPANYKLLNTKDRLVENKDQSSVKCDQRDLALPDWFRFTDAEGDHIPESCVPMRRCGAHSPGWLNGKHPSVQEGVVVRQVCYHWTDGCCQWKNNVKIRNCGNFYVYELQRPPVCALRYCGDKVDPKSRCAQGCLREGRRKRSLYSQETNDEEYILAQGPFVRSESDDDETDFQKQMEMNEVESPCTALVVAVIVVFVVVGVTCGSIYAWKKKY